MNKFIRVIILYNNNNFTADADGYENNETTFS